MILFRGSVAASSGAGRDVHPYWWKVTTDSCAESRTFLFLVIFLMFSDLLGPVLICGHVQMHLNALRSEDLDIFRKCNRKSFSQIAEVSKKLEAKLKALRKVW